MGTEIEKLQTALSEFLRWYNQRYTMPIDIQLDAHNAMVRIRYDITEEIEECEYSCVQQTKRILNKQVDEEKIEESCSNGCFVDVTAYIDARFDDIRTALFKYLNKYGIEHIWQEEGWEDLYRYLIVYIPTQQ